jgi:CubicO group peptidase (beta-lactamase class C family)
MFFGFVSGCAVTPDAPQSIAFSKFIDDSLPFEKPLPNSSYMPSNNSTVAHHNFSGNVILSSIEMKIKPKIRSKKNIVGDPKMFPAVTLNFFFHKGDLVPVTRDIIFPDADRANNSYWQIIIQPGSTWSEPGDNGWSRASFPFALMNSLENETHNGIAMFLYTETEMSAVYFQIVTQTTPWLIREHFSAWGKIPAKYVRKDIRNLKALKTAYENEINTKFPVAEWSRLEQQFGNRKLSGFEGKLRRYEKITSAILINDILYYKPCETKFGIYPYTLNMRFGIWSVTKSVGPGLGMLRLAQKYGPKVFDLKIKDYVEINSNHDGWKEVTFEDALNMATGIGDRTNSNRKGIYADYGSDISPYKLEWTFSALSAKDKIKVISKSAKYPWGPGKKARYSDRDMFILGAAMDGFLKSKEGSKADIWNMITEEVFKPIHIYHAPINRTIETDGSPGLPLMAWGWYPTLDDLAKISRLLHQKGNYKGKQILHYEKTKSFFSIQGSLGAGHNWDYGERRYKNAFHYIPFPALTGKMIYLPYMSGWRGNTVLFMPGNMTGITISNAWPTTHTYDPENPTPIAKVCNRIKPFTQWDQ